MADIKFPTGCEMMKVDALIPYAKNPKEHTDKDIDLIIKSINRNGWGDPILVCPETSEILSGNGRYLAARKIGLSEVPVVYAPEGLTEKQKADLVIASNKLVEVSGYNDNLTALVAEFDLSFDDFGMEVKIDPEPKEIVEDEVPETVETRCKRGDIWQLGNHRLMCGDSTSIDDVDKLMNGEKADMVFTDPPYGVSYEGGLNEKKKQQIKNDSITDKELYNFLCALFTNAKISTKDKSPFYVFYATKTSKEFINAFCDCGLKQRAIIAWYKQGGGFGDFMAHYMNAYEPCIYGSNGESVNWYGASNEKTVWEINKEKKCDLHPTMKPIEVVARAIRNSSAEKNSVLDVCGGSGSTLIACEQLDRKCYMMELDEHYCDVIIQRWENLTGKQANKVTQ